MLSNIRPTATANRTLGVFITLKQRPEQLNECWADINTHMEAQTVNNNTISCKVTIANKAVKIPLTSVKEKFLR